MRWLLLFLLLAFRACAGDPAFAQTPQVGPCYNGKPCTLTNPTITGGNASAANVTATGSTTARTLAARAADVVNAKDFGVKCDGTTDDTSALQVFLNAITSGKRGVLPSGTCLFSNTINLPNSYASLFGSGMYSTTLEYDGVSTTADLISFGAQATQTVGLDVEGFRVMSTTAMTSAAAAAIHIKTVVRSTFKNIVADGQDGNGNLWNGIWFDQVDTVHLSNFESRGQNDAMRVNGVVGSGAKADLFVTHGKVGSSGAGVHIGGAFGGLVIDDVDDIVNGTNVLVDTALASEGNRELFFGHGFLADSASSSDNFYINDALAASGIISIRGWVASSTTASGVHVVHWAGSRLNINAATIFNNKLDGVRIDDSTPIVNVSPDTMIRNNQGYGINATVATNNLFAGSGSEDTNTLGPVSSNASGILTNLPGIVRAHSTVVGNLPTCGSNNQGAIAAVTDANAPTWGGTLTGGGTTEVLAVCNGTIWTAH